MLLPDTQTWLKEGPRGLRLPAERRAAPSHLLRTPTRHKVRLRVKWLRRSPLSPEWLIVQRPSGLRAHSKR